MKWLTAIAMIILLTSTAYADFFYKLVGCECDEKANAVISIVEWVEAKSEK